MSIKFNPKVLVSASTTTTGSWYPLDYKFNGSQERLVIASMDANAVSASDVIQIQATPDEFTNTTSISTVVTVTSFTTTNFNSIFNGPWTAVRAVKTGAGGVGWVRFVG